MSLTPSTMLPLGAKAPDFSLIDVSGGRKSLSDFSGGKGLLIVFMCNHCPFVKHIKSEFLKFARDAVRRGLKIAGISANDVSVYPDDSPSEMLKEAVSRDYPFPYLYDELQETAKAYHAACTPDFFLFDKDLKLVYRGRFDDSTPGNDIPVTGKDLKAAVNQLLAGEEVNVEQKPSMGCNIKWRKGNEPEYFKTA